MEFDPLAKDVAPPRHEIESDSEDESVEVGKGNGKRAFVAPSIRLELTSIASSDHLVILLSEGGEGFLQGDEWVEEGKLFIDEEQVSKRSNFSQERRWLRAVFRSKVHLLPIIANQPQPSYYCYDLPSKCLVIKPASPTSAQLFYQS